MNTETAVKIVDLALRAGEALISAGKDPVVEIKRMLAADPEVAKVHDEWEAELEQKFGPRSAPDAGDPRDGW